MTNPFLVQSQGNPFLISPARNETVVTSTTEPGLFRDGFNFAKNLGGLIYAISPYGARTDEQEQKVVELRTAMSRQASNQWEGAKRVVNQVGETLSAISDYALASNVTATAGLPRAGDTREAVMQRSHDARRFSQEVQNAHPQVEALISSLSEPTQLVGSIVSSAVSMPAMMVDMLVYKPVEAATGMKLTEAEVRPLTQEEGIVATTVSLSNIAMIAAGPAIKAAATSAIEGIAMSRMATGFAVGGAAVAAEAPITISPLIRNIAAHVTTAGAEGVLQGYVAGAGQESVYEQALMGVMFAPIGLLTGAIRFRGFKPELFNEFGVPEQVKAELQDIAALQLNHVTDRMALTEIATLPQALVKAPSLLSSVMTSRIDADPGVVGVINRVVDVRRILKKHGENLALHSNGDGKFGVTPGTWKVLYAGPEAFGENRRAVMNEFKKTGQLPEGARQIASYEGGDYYVGKTNSEGMVAITSLEMKTTKQVPVSELRDIRESVVILDRPAFYDTHFENFQKTHNPDLALAPQIAQYVADNKLGHKAVPITREFGERYNKSIIDSSPELKMENEQLIKLQLDVANMHSRQLTTMSEQLARSARSNNVYIESTNGGYALRDVNSGEIIRTADTAKEARAILNEIAQSQVNANPLEKSLLIHLSEELPDYSVEQWDRLSQESMMFDVDRINGTYWGGSKLDLLLSSFDAAHPRFASFEAFLAGVDQLHGTRLHGQYYFDTQAETRKLKSTIKGIRNSPLQLAIENLATVVVKNGGEARMETISGWIETLSYDEMSQPNGLASNFDVSQTGAEKIAQEALARGVDLRNVYRWRRQRYALENQYKSYYVDKARTQLAVQLENLTSLEFDPEAIRESLEEMYKSIANQYLADPKYIKELAKLDGDVNILSGNKLGDYSAIDDMIMKELKGNPKHSANTLYGASRIWDALREPEKALTRADYATKHNMSHTELKLGELINQQYEFLGDKFGVNSDGRLVGFLNHYRSWGDPLDPPHVQRFVDGMDDAGQREFVSSMLRTGEVGNYVRNPLHALDAYIRTGAKLQLHRTLDNWAQFTAEEILKITNLDVRKKVAERVHSYEDSLLGVPELDERHYRGIKQRLLEHMGQDPQTVAKAIEGVNSGFDTVQNLVSSSLLGARPVMAIRDFGDVIQKYNVFHGPARVKRLLQQMGKGVSVETYNTLVDIGAIVDADYKEIYNPTTAAKKPTWLNKTSSELAQVAFETSYQPQMFKKLQVAIYLESREFTRQLLNDVLTDKTTKAKAYEKLFMNSWDDATKQYFDDLVTGGHVEKAAHYLAVNETQRSAGIAGMGNAPQGAGTVPGRIWNQMGMWTISNRSIFARMLSRGTPAEVMRSRIRWAMGNAAVAATGLAFGFNMTRWYTTPISFIPTGGPLIDAAKTVSSVMSAYSPTGGEAQRNFALKQLQQSALMPVPFGYAARGMYRGYQLGMNGENFGFVRPVWAATGGSVSELPNATNIFMGSIPVAPEAGTNLNTALFRYMTPD
jgi:hypothetical protein